MKTLVVAEAGSCHGGDLDRARRMIGDAARAGADVCKFQWTSDPARLCERRRAFGYLAAYRLIEFPESWHSALAEACADAGIEYMCTVFLPEDVATIAPYVSRFKIASFEAADRGFVAAHRSWSKPVMISTGMMTLAEVHFLGLRQGDVLMHCVSAYPCPMDQAGLGAIQALRGRWPGLVGYSDHTGLELTGALAVAVGARVVEVHFCALDTDPANLDMAVALPPDALVRYVAMVRQAEVMMGDGVKIPAPAEAAMMAYRVCPA